MNKFSYKRNKTSKIFFGKYEARIHVTQYFSPKIDLKFREYYNLKGISMISKHFLKQYISFETVVVNIFE